MYVECFAIQFHFSFEEKKYFSPLSENDNDDFSWLWSYFFLCNENEFIGLESFGSKARARPIQIAMKFYVVDFHMVELFLAGAHVKLLQF